MRIPLQGSEPHLRQLRSLLFKINGGQEGYYLANILDKQYYYCGKNPYDVKAKLNELGIIRPE